MCKSEITVNRGDVYFVSLNVEGAEGHEQTGYRPALVIQNNVGNYYRNYARKPMPLGVG